jgi:V-type H+-transporting ATPase subunit C
MPSEDSTWLIAAPQDGESEGLEQELFNKLSQQSRSFTTEHIAEFPIPSFKVSALSNRVVCCLNH